MKKLFQKINSKVSRSIVLGLLLALAFTSVQSALANQIDNSSSSTTPFVSHLTGLVSRIGSLSIGGPFPSAILNASSDCILNDTPILFLDSGNVGTCLNVTGTGLFTNVLVQQIVASGGNFIVGDPTLPSTTSLDGSRPIEPNFLVKADGTSIMIGGLVYPDPGTFSPRDVNTSERNVCGDANGKIVICSSTATPVNGQCGSADGGSTPSAPTSNLCTSGTPSSVSTNSGNRSGTTYTWTCAGSNGGTNDSCSSNQSVTVVNGQCATFFGTHGSQPANSSNGCTSGNYSDLSDTSSEWRWSCNGTGGGTNDTPCTATRTQVSYNWQIGNWGSCQSNGSCNGTPSQGEIDWNANPFDWQNQRVYNTNGDIIAYCPYVDMFVGNNINDTDGNGGATNGSPACTAALGNDSTGSHYWVDNANNTWQQLILNTGVVTQIFNNQGALYGTGPSCSTYSSANSCDAAGGCNWLTAENSQTRVVTCRDSGNQIVSDSLCPQPKPITLQGCGGGGGGTNYVGCDDPCGGTTGNTCDSSTTGGPGGHTLECKPGGSPQVCAWRNNTGGTPLWANC